MGNFRAAAGKDLFAFAKELCEGGPADELIIHYLARRAKEAAELTVRSDTRQPGASPLRLVWWIRSACGGSLCMSPLSAIVNGPLRKANSCAPPPVHFCRIFNANIKIWSLRGFQDSPKGKGKRPAAAAAAGAGSPAELYVIYPSTTEPSTKSRWFNVAIVGTSKGPDGVSFPVFRSVVPIVRPAAAPDEGRERRLREIQHSPPPRAVAAIDGARAVSHCGACVQSLNFSCWPRLHSHQQPPLAF